MTEKTDKTEERILAAAQKVFTQKGMSGARMQEIADEAGINKALLHYYFRSKEKLFRRIFESALQQIIGEIFIVINTDEPLFVKIRAIVDLYMDGLFENPKLPIFVLSEINQNPERLEKLFSDKMPAVLPKFFLQIEDEVKKGKINPIHPVQLMLNILGMVIFPFAARPLLERIFQNYFQVDMDKLFRQRKEVVYNFIVQALTKK